LPSIRKARALRPGSRVGLAAPAGPISKENLDHGADAIRALGFEPVFDEGVLATHGYLAGSDARRAEELQRLVDDPEIEGILCVRGGYGCHRLMASLDAKRFRAAAKPLVGYSDITTLLLWQRRVAGLMGIHGPMLEKQGALAGEQGRSLARALMGSGPLPRLPGEALAGGWAEGRLVGGSLSLVAASLGTPWEIDTRDVILLLEDVTEQPYRIDRMLMQLIAAGKLEGVVGIGFGCMHECEDARYPALGLDEVIDELLLPLGIPILRGLPFGHAGLNLAWPFGVRAAIDGDRGEIELLEHAVAKNR